ncbi:uncharacterized protein LOC110984253 [Acanthaster planci]|uniref:Uncharacterized protein LOC110984253 n=1 Tax=Acanthaster planci TaxID=133434 RepID=A0A8B7Z2U0_ACAPL|nr:uncharacterized protein LOC110984253 [Acanthaster planci]
MVGPHPRHPLQPLQVNLTAGILSSFPRVPYEQIQSPTVFSSPRLFPTTIQAVQSQQSVPSSTLFSPLKLADHKLVKDCSHSDALTSFDVQGTELQTSQKTTERENDKSVFDFDSQQLPGLNVATVKEDSDCSTHHRMSDFTTSSAPSDGVQMSPNIGFRRYAPKVAIVTPGSAPNMPDISAQEAQSSRSVLECKSTLPADMGSRKQLGTTQKGTNRSHHFFPSPAVRDSLGIQTLATSLTSPTADVQDSLNAARPEIADEGQLCIKTSPYVGPRSCGSARSKPELLEQKKAELARLRAEKAQLKKTLKTENELTDQELDIVTRLHTIRNSRHGNMQGLTVSPVVTQTPTERDKGSLHLRWHSSLVTEVQYLSSPGHPVRVARPILAKQGFSRARHVPVTRTASPAQ